MSGRMFENKVVLVTGGGQGMGRAAARRFAEEGAKVGVVDIDFKRAESTVRAIHDAGGEAIALHADVALEADNDRIMDETSSRFGGLDVVHLNAGVLGHIGNFFESTAENFDRVVAINLRGCYLGLKSAGRVLRPEGAVVAMSSTAGTMGWAENVTYSATKHGIIGLVKTAATAYGARGLRVNAICPGTVNTRMFNPTPTEDPIVPASELKVSPFRGVATAQHVAELVLYLASSRAAYITGTIVVADGGLTSSFVAG